MYIVNGQNKKFETYRVNEQIKELETWRDMISNGEQSKCDVRSEIDVINDAINTIQILSTRIQEKNVLKTNADRICSMTDEELADNIMCPNETGLAEIKCIKSDSCNCYDCCLKFLQSEREEV